MSCRYTCYRLECETWIRLKLHHYDNFLEIIPLGPWGGTLPAKMLATRDPMNSDAFLSVDKGRGAVQNLLVSALF